MKEKNITVRKSPKGNPENQCKFKYKYDLKRRAIKDARSLTVENPEFIFTVYECPYCGKYHVGKLQK